MPSQRTPKPKATSTTSSRKQLPAAITAAAPDEPAIPERLKAPQWPYEFQAALGAATLLASLVKTIRNAPYENDERLGAAWILDARDLIQHYRRRRDEIENALPQLREIGQTCVVGEVSTRSSYATVLDLARSTLSWLHYAICLRQDPDAWPPRGLPDPILFDGTVEELESLDAQQVFVPELGPVVFEVFQKNVRRNDDLQWNGLFEQLQDEARQVEPQLTRPVDFSAVDAQSRIEHSPDYRSVVWAGEPYEFTPPQACVVKVLWDAWEKGTPSIGDVFLLESIDRQSPPPRLDHVFRNGKRTPHPAWSTMIVAGQTKGTHRLSDPPSPSA
jgi:hypothetical protein